VNSGVPATEVARRAGHGIAVLLKIYAHCIDGRAGAANQRITDALSTPEADQDSGDEGDAGSLKCQVSKAEAMQNGQLTAPGDGLDTAPALAVRARPCVPPPLSPVRTDA
jgi:hypothetical protein